MKISDATRFAHPVLSPFTDDYAGGSLGYEVEIREDVSSGKIEIVGATEVTQGDVRALIESGEARCGLYVTCLETYHTSLEAIRLGQWTVVMPSGSLRGTVRLRPVIHVGGTILNITSNNVHPEFEPQSLQLASNDLVGLGSECRFEAGMEKLAPMESVFKLTPDESLDDGRFVVDTESQAVDIRVSPLLFAQISEMRDSASARNVLLSSLYLPCVVELLSIASEEDRSDLRWLQAIRARCSQLGIQLDGKYLVVKAQRLLGNPLGLLHKAVGDLSR